MRSKTDFATVYRANYRSIVSYFATRLGDAEQAEDLAGAVFYKAWKAHGRFRRGSSVRAWLFAIARNTLIDHLRKQKDMTLSDIEENRLVSAAAQPEAALREQERLWALADGLDGLSGTMKSVVILRFIERMSVKEVARTLDISESSVRTTQFRALAKLREVLGDERVS